MSASLSAILNPSDSFNTNSSPSNTFKKIIQLIQDQQIWVQVLWDIGWAYKNIAVKYNITIWAVQYTCTHPQTPQKWSGKPPQLFKEQVNILVDFVTVFKANQQLSYWCLTLILEFDCEAQSIQHALQQQGFWWCLACNKPSISSKNQQLQLV